MNYQPLVTIITPVYNQANYVGETIESVLAQDYPNVEYIVINDGSTDNTSEVLNKYSTRIHWESHKNIGETATINKGLSKAKGEIIGIINSDDLLLPFAITEMVNFFIAHSDIAVVYPDWKMIDEEGNVTEIITTFDYDYRNMLRWHYCLPGVGTFFRKDIFLELGGRDPQFRYVADFDFWLRAGLISQFSRIPRILACYRRYAGGATSSKRSIEMAEEHIRLVNKIYSLADLPINLLQIKKEAYGSAYYYAGLTCGRNFWLKIKYYLAALKYTPHKYFGEYRYRVPKMFFSLLFPPESSRNVIKLRNLFKNRV